MQFIFFIKIPQPNVTYHRYMRPNVLIHNVSDDCTIKVLYENTSNYEMLLHIKDQSSFMYTLYNFIKNY